MFFSIRKLSNTIIIAASLIIGISSTLNASPLVLVEMYGQNSCAPDTQAQEELLGLLKTQDNIILINCRKLYDSENEDTTDAKEFCFDRSYKYNSKFGYIAEKTPIVIVNGRWEAYAKDITPAVDLGRLDKINQISISLNEDNLDITIPNIETKQKAGVLMLFVYLPTHGVENTRAKQLRETRIQDFAQLLALDEGKPFVKQDIPKLYLRSVLAIENLGEWNGEEMSLSYPLDSLRAEIMGQGISFMDLSYVTVLFEGEQDFGSVLAAGEIVADIERNLMLPKSKPLVLDSTAPIIEPIPEAPQISTPDTMQAQ